MTGNATSADVTSGILVIMGSGETAPTMRAVHAEVLGRVGHVQGPAVLLDTPYGFQENADELTARAREYFATNVGAPIEPARWRTAEDDATDVARALAQTRGARYVFAGPGSPSYALRLWRGTGLTDALLEVLRRGGAVTFASAAALTLGVASVPVYEIYKAGEPPHWLEGLGLMARVLGVEIAVVPHYDNHEGGGHDTRFAYLGERRLAVMERTLDEGAFVLGVDEHTALVLDLGAQQAEVRGRGTVTVRRRAGSTVFASGETLPLDVLRDPAAGTRRQPARVAGRHQRCRRTRVAGTARPPSPRRRPGSDAPSARRSSSADVDDTVTRALELEQTIADWSGDTLESDENGARPRRAAHHGREARRGRRRGRP